MIPRCTVMRVNMEKKRKLTTKKLTSQMVNSSAAELSAPWLNMMRNEITVAMKVKRSRTGRELSESMSGKRPPTTPMTKKSSTSSGVAREAASRKVAAALLQKLETVRCVLNSATLVSPFSFIMYP